MASSFEGSRGFWGSVLILGKLSFWVEVSLIAEKILPMVEASFSVEPVPSMCMNMSLGESHKRWLWSAVIWISLSRARVMMGLI